MLIDYKKRYNKSNKGINRFLKRHIKSKRDIDLKKKKINSKYFRFKKDRSIQKHIDSKRSHTFINTQTIIYSKYSINEEVHCIIIIIVFISNVTICNS